MPRVFECVMYKLYYTDRLSDSLKKQPDEKDLAGSRAKRRQD